MTSFHRFSGRLASAVALAVALHAGGSGADELAAPTFSFSGFGTLGIVHSSEGNADYTSTPSKPRGTGYSHAWSAEVDSLVAAQLTATFTPRWSALVQVLSEQNYDHSYTPHVEWANVKYLVTPDFSIRGGRTALPIFMMSDSRKVGYANPWVRPPVEVYTLVPVTSNDGIDASYRFRIGATNNTFQITAGQSDPRFPGGSTGGRITAKARRLFAVADTIEHGFATFRLNYGRTNLTIAEFGPLFDAFRQFGPEGNAIADRYDPRDRVVTFVGVGASYDPGRWFVMGEWGRIDNDHTPFGTKTGWYVAGGRRLGNFTPYAIYAEARASTLADPGLSVSRLPPYLAGPATGLNVALNSILSTNPVQNTGSVGVRWDIMRNTALKLQFDHTRIGAGSTGEMANTQPGFRLGGKVNLFSATVDFVF